MPTTVNINGLSAAEVAMIPRLLRFIKTASRGSPIKSPVIEEKMGVKGHRLRTIFSRLKAARYEIGSDHTGYWWAEKPEDLDPAIEFLDQKAGATVAAVRGLKQRKRDMILKIRRVDERIRTNQPVQQGTEAVPGHEQTQLSFLV